MIFDFTTICCTQEQLDVQFSAPYPLEGAGLWIGLISSGQCALSGDDSPQMAGAGSVLLGAGPLRLVPAAPCHLLAVRITGSAANTFMEALPQPMFAAGTSCPGAAELLVQLAGKLSPRRSCELAYQLLCECAEADAQSPSLPPLVVSAIAFMREHYAGLYGIEELSQTLGVSKSHLVRVFHQSVGVTPGQYLTSVRIEAAKQLLCRPDYTLEVVASLCGFSGANYLCRAFKKATGQSPAAWRACAGQQPGHLLPLERELYV